MVVLQQCGVLIKQPPVLEVANFTYENVQLGRGSVPSAEKEWRSASMSYVVESVILAGTAIGG